MKAENFCDNCGRLWNGEPKPIMVGELTACCKKCARELRQPYSGPSEMSLQQAERRQLGITD